MKEKKERKIIETNDLVAELKSICYANTSAYRCDFEKDIEIILSEAQKTDGKRKTLLWMSYPSGTHCLYEEEVFLEGSPANLVWRFYNHQMSEAKKIAYAIKIENVKDEKVAGVLYELDFEEHCKRVEERAVPADNVRYIFERGTIECSVGRSNFTVQRGEKEFGKKIDCQWIPNNPRKHKAVILTEELCRDGKRTKLEFELKEIIQERWKKDKVRHMKGEQCQCLRCGEPLDMKLAHNSLSRYADVYVCSDCGMDEAVRSIPGNHALNLSEWSYLRNLLPIEKNYIEMPCGHYLTTKCDFGEVFKTKDPGTRRPLTEAAYSRSYYDGYRWYTNWFLNGSKLDSPLSDEIDGFMEALFEMPEFVTLQSMKRAMVAAEMTSDPTEFNLYSETHNFHIWIRAITRERDYNLYVHYYRKRPAEV